MQAKMTTRKQDKYYWIEFVSNNIGMDFLISNFPEIILDKTLAIVSFDCDSLLPTKEEFERGWIYENEIAYFDKVNTFELSQNSIFDIYDQWLIFDEKQRFNTMDIYASYGAFSVNINSNEKDQLQLFATKKFWKEIEEIKPQKFILNGDKFIFGTDNETEYKKIKGSIRQKL